MDSIIFDVDGTLWDSTGIVAEAWMEYLKKEEGIDLLITAEELKRLFGRLLSEIGAEVFKDFPQEDQMRLTEGCCLYENQVLAKRPAPLYPGMTETLTELSRRIPLFIVSNCQAGYIEAFLEGTGLGHLFRGHLCPGDTGEAKAANIRTIVREYGLKEPCYVGDTLGDYTATTEAGIPFVFASYGFGQVPEAGYRIEKPEDLLTLSLEA